MPRTLALSWIVSPRTPPKQLRSSNSATVCLIPAMLPASKKSKMRAENGSWRNLSLTPARFNRFLAVSPLSVLFRGPDWFAPDEPDSEKWLFTWRSSIT